MRRCTGSLAVAVAAAVVVGLAAGPATGVPLEGARGAVAKATSQGTAARESQPPPSGHLRLKHVKTIYGSITPKSVVASRPGLVFAQNMMYRHTITVYGRRMNLLKTIQDRVRLSRKGYPQYEGSYRGAPVEAAISPDQRFAYVTNYSMYGPDLQHPGSDSCSPSSGIDPSFVYRISLEHLRIGPVMKVGSVPKVVAVTPDNRYVLVTNWCSYDLSVISVKRKKQIERIPIGRYPRGIAVSPDSRIAYVAVMGSSDIAKVNLRTFRVTWMRGIGSEPRALVMSPDGRFMYATLNGEGSVVKIDLRSEQVVDRTFTGSEPRSMAIATDGLSLYVVNYESQTASKVRTADMKVLQSVRTGHHPIGISYHGPTRRVWVACYSGSLMVFKDAVRR